MHDNLTNSANSSALNPVRSSKLLTVAFGDERRGSISLGKDAECKVKLLLARLNLSRHRDGDGEALMLLQTRL